MKYLLLLLMAGGSLWAQDPIFSQFSAAKSYLNPAMTGYDPGTTLHYQQRDQWRQIRSGYSRFRTQHIAVSVGLPCLKSGFGFAYTDNEVGEGYLRWQNFAASYANEILNVRTPSSKYYSLVAGVRASYSLRSLNWRNLVFSDQLDAIYGITSPQPGFVPANLQTQSKGYFDVDAGLLFEHEQLKINKIKFQDVRVGFTVNHLIPTNTSLLGYDERQPKRWTLYGSAIHRWRYARTTQDDERHTIYIVPLLKVDFQDASKRKGAFTYMSWNYGAALSANVPTSKTSNFAMTGGAYMQTRNFAPDGRNISSLIVLGGLGFDVDGFNVRLNFSRDFVLTGLNNNTGGSTEFGITLNPTYAKICDPLSPAMRRLRWRKCPAL